MPSLVTGFSFFSAKAFPRKRLQRFLDTRNSLSLAVFLFLKERKWFIILKLCCLNIFLLREVLSHGLFGCLEFQDVY